jgi:hypothetical protein
VREVIKRWLIPVGVMLTAAGIGGFFLLDYLSYEDPPFYRTKACVVILSILWFSYPVGLLGTLVGSVSWARRGDPGNVLGAALLIVLMVFLTGSMIPFNVHSWTMSIAFAYFVALLIALMFCIFGIGRGLNS